MTLARSRSWIVGTVAAAATAIVMFATEPMLAIGWDEGFTLGREARLRLWFQALANPQEFSSTWVAPTLELVQPDGLPAPRPEQLRSRSSLLFDPEVVSWFWPFAREEPHGHPPFYALLGLVGDLIAPGFDVLPRARIGPILLFSMTAGVIAGFMLSRFGTWSSAVATAAWVLQPNLFAHGHYAAYDGIASSLWVLAIVAFSKFAIPATPARIAHVVGWSIPLGLILGAAAGTKFTGWFLPLPFLVWTACYRSRCALKGLAIAIPIAAVVFLAMIPPWWTSPLASLFRFLNSNLNRAESIPIQVQFLGKVYQTPLESLPFYNTLVWTVLVTPVGLVGLWLTGLVRTFRRPRENAFGALVALHWAFLIVLRAMPHTPGHDGVRLFLPAFGMLALLVGIGEHTIVDWKRGWGKVVGLAVMLEAAVSVAVMMPMPLSYFSPIVGGLPGAAKLGMEPTYYWDALDSSALRWLRLNTGPEETVVFHTFPRSWLYLRETEQLPGIAPIDRGRPRWVVFQNRPGEFTASIRTLVREATPAYKVEKLGVPLVWIFPYEEVARRGIKFRD